MSDPIGCIDLEPISRDFLEYERHLRRAIAEAFGIPAQKSIDFRAGFENDVLSPLYQDLGLTLAEPEAPSGGRQATYGPPADHG